MQGKKNYCRVNIFDQLKMTLKKRTTFKMTFKVKKEYEFPFYNLPLQINSNLNI